MEVDENPNRFWKPILSLGSRAHLWVDTFFTHWFWLGLGSTRFDRFVVEWQRMLDFAFSSELWDSESNSGWFHTQSFWCHLIGIDNLTLRHWKKEHQVIVSRMRPYYERWAKSHLSNSESARLFARWLKRPAATPIRLENLIWLRVTAQRADDSWWQEHSLANELAELLDVCWRFHRTELSAQANTDTAFKQLLKILVDRQNLLAMDLQERIATGD